MKLSHPVLVGNTDILTASEEQLTNIIRQAKLRIEQDKDMAEMSTSFKAKAKELEEIIKLCIAQLDKDVNEAPPTT